MARRKLAKQVRLHRAERRDYRRSEAREQKYVEGGFSTSSAGLVSSGPFPSKAGYRPGL
jgi:hypothetical protein